MPKKFNLQRFQAGQPLLDQLSATRLNAMLDAIDRCGIVFGRNITGIETAGGAVIRAKFNATKSGLDLNCSFLMRDASASEGDPPVVTNKVLIADGKVNGTLPSGMGGGDYTLTIAAPEDSIIYVGVTFDPTDLTITSRFLDTSTSVDFPENEIDVDDIGHVYFPIGFTYVDPDQGFTIYQTWLGDINFQLVYGALDGAPALFPMFGVEPIILDLT